MTNLKIMKFKAFQFKELLKVYLSNINEPQFRRTRQSMLAMIVLPGFTIGAFNLVSPFSIFKGVITFASIFGTAGSFAYNLADDLDTIARKRQDKLGFIVRYRF